MPLSRISVSGHSLISEAVPRGATVIDLGANRGRFSVEMRRQFDAKCYLVEANPKLAAECRLLGLTEVLESAVGRANGHARFNLAINDEASSLLQSSRPHDEQLDAINVPVVSLDSVLNGFRLSTVDVLKMDVEGVEGDVILGASDDALQNTTQLCVEFHTEAVFGFDVLQASQQAWKRLNEIGFVAMDFTRGRRMDVLFVNVAKFPVRHLERQKLLLLHSPPAWVVTFWKRFPPPLKRVVKSLVK